MRILYLASSGTSDPTRASVPLHLAVNGSVEIGHEVEIVLAGDATELLLPEALDSVQGLGVPPARELLSKAQAHAVPIFV
jgi:predicted peroxiredoxin